METTPAPIPDDSEVTVEKAKWIEEQINRNFAFRIESFEILTKSAETTLGWLFGIVVGASGYVASHLSDEPFRITIPLLLATLLAGFEALLLIMGAMMTEEVASPGNIAENIATDERLKISEKWMRISEARGLSDTIKEIEEINNRKGKAINRARMAVVIIPALTMAIMIGLALAAL